MNDNRFTPDIDVEEWDEFTSRNQWNAVYTVQLGELVDKGLFNWSDDVLNWSDAAYDEEQYSRVCAYFIERFYYREISIEPYLEWARILHYKIAYELMPKYKPLYERLKDGISPLADSNEYYKNRTIQSAYPETLLSENADYITDGKDEEFQRIKENNFTDASNNFYDNYRTIDKALLDELETMFVSMYTLNINSGW